MIGLRFGMGHARAWAARPDCRLVAVADLDSGLRERAAQELDVPETYGDYRDLLDQSDAEIVSVCLPTPLHEPAAVACLRGGRHVLCEKPPALDAAAAQRMAAAAMETGRTLGYGLQRRFDPQVRAARRAIQIGRTGPLFYGRAGWVRSEPNVGGTTGWRLDRAAGGGGLLNIGIHLLDVAWYLMGCPRPVAASAFGSTHGTAALAQRTGLALPARPANDTTAALIRFESEHGPAALLLESSLVLHRAPGQETYCDLSGTDGGLSVYPPLFVAGGDTEPLAAPEDEPNVAARDGLVDDFVRAVETGAEPRTGPAQAVTLMRIVDAVERSADARREMAIPA